MGKEVAAIRRMSYCVSSLSSNNEVLTGYDRVEELLFLACSARLVRADAAAFVDWVCRGELQMPPRAGVLVTVAGAAVFLRNGARGGLTPPPVPPRGTTMVYGKRGVNV